MELEDLSHERRRMHGRLLLRFAVIVAAAILAALFGSVIFAILLPLVIAYLVAGILNVPIKWLQKHFGATRNVGSVLISVLLVLIVGTLIGAAIYRIYQEAVGFVANWDSMELDVIATLQNSATQLANLLGLEPATAAWISETIEQVVLWVLQWLQGRMSQLSFPRSGAGGRRAHRCGEFCHFHDCLFPGDFLYDDRLSGNAPDVRAGGPGDGPAKAPNCAGCGWKGIWRVFSGAVDSFGRCGCDCGCQPCSLWAAVCGADRSGRLYRGFYSNFGVRHHFDSLGLYCAAGR